MARKIKFTSDPDLARPHKKGAVVEAVQPSLHNVFGTIHILWYRYWLFHAKKADDSFQKLKKLEAKLLKIPVNTANIRLLSDKKLIDKIYFTGFDLVVNVVLTVEYLSEEIFRISKAKPRKGNYDKFTTSEKLKWIGEDVLGIKDITDRVAYDKFIEMESLRHAVMHPKQETVYNAKEGEWDKVPLAWFVSGKWKEAYTKWEELLEELIANWEKIRQKYKKPGTLTGVKRGIRSEEPVKLPNKT